MFGLGLPLFAPFETNRTTSKLTAIRMMMTVHVFSSQVEPASMPNKIDQKGQ